MKLRTILISAVFGIIIGGCSGCDYKEALDRIAKSIEDVSSSAVDLMGRVNDISRLVDSKMESGELDRQVGNLLDQRLANVSTLLQNAMQNSGGYLFDEANGTVNNAFANIRLVLDQIEKGILKDVVPSLIDQLGGQLQMQLNTISGSVEQLVVVTTESAVLVVDKTINGLVITLSIIALVVGLITFIVILILMRRNLNTANIIGVGFMGIFTVFFLVMTLSSNVRGNVISGFNFAAKRSVRPLTPTVTGVIPEKITLGTTKNVYVYGKFLNKINNPSVVLTQGNSKMFTFPAKTVVVATANRIVLGNFDELLNWKPVTFQAFKTAIMPKLQSSGVSEATVASLGGTMRLARASSLKAVRFGAIDAARDQMVERSIGAGQAVKLTGATSGVFLDLYKLKEGEYAISVFGDTSRVESPQYLMVMNPPPPAKLPDISCTDMRWSGNLTAVAGQMTSLDVDLMIDDAQEDSMPFQAKITSVPATTSLLVDVPMGKILAARQNGGKVTVTTRTFSVPSRGSYKFNISIDDLGAVPESNEANNTFSKNLFAYEYLYNAELKSFQIDQKIVAGGKIYTTTVVTVSTGFSKTYYDSVIPLAVGRLNFKCNAQLENLPVGTNISVSMNAVWRVIQYPAPTISIPLGNEIFSVDINDYITDNNETKDLPIERKAKNCTFFGTCAVSRVKG
jgi:hypothetical protein